MEWVRRHFTQLGSYASHPAAFGLVCLFGVAWWFFNPATFEWHAIATLVTLLIALFIQRTGHRDTQALHAKLDELLRTHPAAKTELARLDDKEPEDIEQFRQDQRMADLKS